MIKCPNCNSENVIDSDEKYLRGIDLGFGVSFSVEVWDQVCSDCGFQGSLDGAMDKKFEKAHLAAHEKIIQIVSDRLRSIASDTQIEMAFRLFPRTLKNWREMRDLSDSSTALFKLLAKYPHILDQELREFKKKSSPNTNSDQG